MPEKPPAAADAREPEPDSNYFATALAHMDYGALLPSLSEDLQLLVKEVKASGRNGSLTLTLKLKPTGNRGQVEIISDSTLKRPKADPGKSIFFATDRGELLREDPRQKTLKFGEEFDEHAPRKAKVGS
jgi:hypothetical protein